MSKTVDDAIRIRDNQRRSRARRKDLIKDLQIRVQEYELRGVTATQDMQRAARKVAQENERLRILLARHGVLKDEVDTFLRSYEQTNGSAEPEVPTVNSPSVLSPHPTNPGPRSIQIQPLGQAYRKDYSPRPSPVQIPRQSVQGGCLTTRREPPTRNSDDVQVETTILMRPVEACRQAESYYASPSETDSSPPRPMEPVQSRSPPTQSYQHESQLPRAYTYPDHQPFTRSQGCCPPARNQPNHLDPIQTTEDPDCPSTADCFCPPILPAPEPTRNTASIGTDEISCETAATIIAQMRGDGDDAAARASLGCATGEVCGIKNSFLMQIMDER